MTKAFRSKAQSEEFIRGRDVGHMDSAVRVSKLERQLEAISNLLFELVPLDQYAQAAEEYERIVGNGAISRRAAAAILKGKDV